jgi:hypothetical protein
VFLWHQQPEHQRRARRSPGQADRRVQRREDGLPPRPPEEIEAWAAGLSVPAYVIDDQTAAKVVDGYVEVVTEGTWKLLAP